MALTAEQMIAKFGKQKAIDMMVHSPKNGKTGAERDRGIKGWVKHKRCEHGVWVIEDYKHKPCAQCVPEVNTKSKEFKPGFNIGLGAWVESRSEEKQLAKSMGLIEAA